MKKVNRRSAVVILNIFVLILILGGGGLFGYKLYKHEKQQENQITNIQRQIEQQENQITNNQGQEEYLQDKLTQVTDYYNFQPKYKDDTYNYFAIGNSLTLITSWGRGIWSTKPDNDYFNLVKKSLESKYGDVVAYPYNFASWERLSNRAEALDLIDPYLSDDLDLVTIQLGENATDLSTYEEDLENLINYVKDKAPKAKIVIIGDWWSTERNNYRKEAAQNTNVLFADLSDVIGDSSYQSKTGTVCYMSDGKTIEVPEGAAAHPGDKGMKYIANKVIEAIEE